MSNPSAVSLAPAFITAVAGFGGALLAILATPSLQHYFWKSQRREELRLAAIKKLNELTSKFISDAMAFPSTGSQPNQEFFHSFAVAANEVEVLFSEKTFQTFKKLENMMGRIHSPGLLGPSGNQTVDDFILAQKDALRALYNETLPRRGRIRQWLCQEACPHQGQ